MKLYSFYAYRGSRVMGMIAHGALSTLILSDAYFKFPIPDRWTFEEAATIPVVYGTVIYALIMVSDCARSGTFRDSPILSLSKANLSYSYSIN